VNDRKNLSLNENTAFNKRKIKDKAAEYVFKLGGFFIVLSIILIIFFIGKEALPLIKKYSLISKDNEKIENIELSKTVEFFGDEYNNVLSIIQSNGEIVFYDINFKKLISKAKLNLIDNEEITSVVSKEKGKKYIFGTSTGRVFIGTILYKTSYTDELDRITEPNITFSESYQISDSQVKHIDFLSNEEAQIFVAIDLRERIRVLKIASRYEEDELFASNQDENAVAKLYDITSDFGNSIPTDIGIYYNGEIIFVSSNKGRIHYWGIANEVDYLDSRRIINASITKIEMLNGRQAIVAGGEDGSLNVLFYSQNNIVKVRPLIGHSNKIVKLYKANLKKMIASIDESGNVLIHSTTSSKELLSFKINDGFLKTAFATKDRALLTLDKNKINRFNFDIKHPETTFETIFSKVWYEGFDRPEYIWQSSSGSDEFEPKLSLIPLIFGTLKGAFYAIIFAIPIAILAAICVSQFMHPKLKGVIKPIIEVMAALPSVVLGFLAGLWLAPKIDKILLPIACFPILLIILTIYMPKIWERVKHFMHFKKKGMNYLIVGAPLIIIVFILSLFIGNFLESTFFNSDFNAWMYESFQIQYDQRNALIIGIAMGFAVIPIIFTISEDALSNVPEHLISGSLALGATKWQTALKIVFPSASPGIFSAVMIGIGRAVGETMIVLMAAGNTPIMDFSIFNGFRTLSANIAVEIPEAPVGGTLYRTLFLSSFILFCFTFIINSVAEVIRIRLKKKYAEL